MVDFQGGVSGASGGGSDLAGMATQSWVDENYLSIAFFSKLFKTYNGTGSSAVEVLPNDAQSTIDNIKAMFGFWTDQYLSALGQNSGGGGGGTVLTEPLASINTAGLGAPTALNDGMTIVWDASLNSGEGGWKYGSAGGGGGGTGTVTQITTGTGLTGGPITATGEIAINSTYLSYISHGETAYGWGNHAEAGYLTSSSNLNASKINAGTIGFSYLPTMYWANVAVASASSNNTEPRFLNININGFTIEYDSTNQALKFNGSIYATGSVSALGQGSGGGGVSLNEPLASINTASLGMPTQAGQVITWNGSQWVYNIPSGGGGGGTGTVTSITAGTGLSGGTITTMGTIAISSTYLSYISHGETAYGWGNHADAGYLTSVSFSQLSSHPTTISGYGITDAKIQNGTITLGSNTITPLTSVSFSDLTSHPTTISGYGITDAKIQNGTITLGSSSITPITTETDPTVPAWAKASTKPSYSFGELSGTVAYNQLPTLYWANVEVANASDNNTSPQFGSVRLRPGTANYGGYLYFGDGTYAYICEPSDDNLQYKVGSSKTHTFTVGSTDRLTISSTGATINGGMSLSGFINGATNIELSPSSSSAGNGGYIDFHYNQSSSDYTARIIEDASGRIFIDASAGLRIGDCVITWDSTNNALKIQKVNGNAANFYATGGVTALYTS